MLTAEAPIPGAPAPPPGSTPADLAGVNAGGGCGSSVGAPLLTQSVNLAVISSPTTAQYTPQQIEEYQKIYHRFSNLSYYDMHVVTTQCVDFILDQSLQVRACVRVRVAREGERREKTRNDKGSVAGGFCSLSSIVPFGVECHELCDRTENLEGLL